MHDLEMLCWQPLTLNWKIRLRNKIIQRNGHIQHGIETITFRRRLRGKRQTIQARKADHYPSRYLRLISRISYEWKNKSTNLGKHRKLVADAVARVMTKTAIFNSR